MKITSHVGFVPITEPQKLGRIIGGGWQGGYGCGNFWSIQSSVNMVISNRVTCEKKFLGLSDAIIEYELQGKGQIVGKFAFGKRNLCIYQVINTNKLRIRILFQCLPYAVPFQIAVSLYWPKHSLK